MPGELWRALPSDSETGTVSPSIIKAGGARQLIIWYEGAVVSLDPVTGKTYWQQPYKVGQGMSIHPPVQSGSLLFFTNFYNGPLMLSLDEKKPGATVLWRGKSDSEIDTDGLHSVNGTPVIVGDYVYGVCSYGQFRCLRTKTGERVWESQALMKERARWRSVRQFRRPISWHWRGYAAGESTTCRSRAGTPSRTRGGPLEWRP